MIGIRSLIGSLLSGIIPKKQNLILFTAWFGKRYGDSSMYLFEYLLKHSKYELYWYVQDKELYISLKSQGIPVIYSQSLKGYWYQIRANVLVTSVQFDDYNPYLINKCIILDLGHGFPGKPGGLMTPGISQNSRDRILRLQKNTKFYEVASSVYCANCSHDYFGTDYDRIIFANKPRIDVLYSNELQSGKNTLVDKIKGNRRAIVYMPTHRACGQVEIDINSILDLPKIQELCENNNSVFIIKKHYYHRHEKDDSKSYSNIFDISNEIIDSQVLLAQADVLITDFSSCFVDYLALNRPVIFYAFDYEEYLKKERDYYWKYDKITAGYTTMDSKDLTAALENIFRDWEDKTHLLGRESMRSIYFDPDVELGNSREKLATIIEKLINGTYVPFNWNLKR